MATKPCIVSATDRDGCRDTFGRAVASIEHLRMILERDGFTDIEFLDDEDLARMRARRPVHLQPKTREQFRFEASLRRGRDRRALVLRAPRNNALLLMLLAALAGWGLWQRHWLPAGIAVVLALAWLVWLRRRLRSGEAYDEMLKAHARGENERAAAGIARLQAGYAALALTRSGRHDAAQRLLAPWKQIASSCLDPAARRAVATEVDG